MREQSEDEGETREEAPKKIRMRWYQWAVGISVGTCFVRHRRCRNPSSFVVLPRSPDRRQL